MKKLAVLAGSCLLAVGAFAVGHLTAQDHKNLKDAKAPAMTPEMQKMMDSMMANAKVGPEHARLARLVGKWKLDVKSWENAGSTPETSTATASIAPIMGGRFMLEQVNGDWNGMPFEGMSLCGYDNQAKKYQSCWVDNMSTALTTYLGNYDAAKDALVMEGDGFFPITGKVQKFRMVSRWAGEKHVFEAFTNGVDGKEFKHMEITYSKM